TANTVDMGNDGQTGTRWCAANDGLGHWWSVDLGQSYTLTEIEIMWEKTGPYKYLIEGSANGTAWSTLADETASTDTAQNQTLPLAGGPSARHVRISVIGLPEGSWASFFEFSVSGY
ncbi:MAG TPA: discoidin domain-containing protein, partial [Polyangiaceae bacterium]|nr:discoidin domain-containing protein [Polyangiaceae bacterium]